MAKRKVATDVAPRKRRTIWSQRPRLTAREVIAEAAARLGGVDRLVEWALEDPRNEFAFWTRVYPRIIAVDVKVEVGKRLARALTWLPPTPAPLTTQAPPLTLLPPTALSPTTS
jgi:hypothetical protein